MHPLEICVIGGGALTLCAAMLQAMVPRLFGWNNALPAVKADNARIVSSIHLALVMALFAFTALSFIYAKDLAVPAPGSPAFGLDIALAVFWLWRAVWQGVLFQRPAPGASFKVRLLHYPLTLAFAALAAAYAVPAVGALCR